jgi:hypothetical protein
MTRRDLGEEEGRIVKIPAFGPGQAATRAIERASPSRHKESIEKLLRAAGLNESRRSEDYL